MYTRSDYYQVTQNLANWFWQTTSIGNTLTGHRFVSVKSSAKSIFRTDVESKINCLSDFGLIDGIMSWSDKETPVTRFLSRLVSFFSQDIVPLSFFKNLRYRIVISQV